MSTAVGCKLLSSRVDCPENIYILQFLNITLTLLYTWLNFNTETLQTLWSIVQDDKHSDILWGINSAACILHLAHKQLSWWMSSKFVNSWNYWCEWWVAVRVLLEQWQRINMNIFVQFVQCYINCVLWANVYCRFDFNSCKYSSGT